MNPAHLKLSAPKLTFAPRWFAWMAAVTLGWMVAILPTPGSAADWVTRWRSENPVWRGIHVMLRNGKAADDLAGQLDGLKALGVNALIVEIDYGFAFDSHPELRGGGDVVTKDAAKRLTAACHEHGIRLIPQFSCLGHQSWAKQTFPLLTTYPDFDETPGQFPDNKGIYCRSWCPQNPQVNPVVFSLLDEMIDAFGADAIHVGMDEVFLVASEHCPRCKGGDSGKLFAKAVNDLHHHVVDVRKLEMFMWADRFLDSKVMGYGEWEAAKNGTDTAVDLIPKDIVMCDWHYELLTDYPGKPKEYGSIGFLMGKGFRTWPSGWKKLAAIDAFVDESKKHPGDKMLGYLATTWGAVKTGALKDWPPLKEGIERLK
jgi:hypothetical protein